MTRPPSTAARIDRFIARYTPAMRRAIRRSRARMHRYVPRGVELIYDNYNALVFGFGPSERASAAVVSLVAYPQWVTLCFLWGVSLRDPSKRLAGNGNQVRHIRLRSPDDLDDPDVRALIEQALAPAADEFVSAGRLRTVIKAVSARQRPRRSASPRRDRPSAAGA
jgi:hypothetical protein